MVSVRRALLGVTLVLVVMVELTQAQQTAAFAESLALIPADPLRVMTINLQHKDDPSGMKIMAGDLARQSQGLPDFILCQEVLFKRRGELRNTAAVLARELGYYSAGTQRRSDREGIAIISKYPFDHYAEKHLKSNTTGLLLGFKRVSTMGEFTVPGIGRVRVVNVHFTNWGFENHIRRKQLAETLAWLAERDAKVPADVTFLGGDFNAEPHWGEMQQLKQPIGKNRLLFRNFNSTDPTKPMMGSDIRIDNIFVATREPVELLDEQIVWSNPIQAGEREYRVSDHSGLIHHYRVGSIQSTGTAVTGVDLSR